jgi:Mn2+/Fe2+ NRAMP family transporter
MSLSPEVRAAFWTMVGIFVVFKLATTALIVMASPELAGATVGLFFAFHWPFILGGVILAAAPLAFWMRLVRVRAKRARLQAAEWRND